MEVKNILDSLHDKLANKEITLRQAAEQLCKAGWTDGFIDIDLTKQLLKL